MHFVMKYTVALTSAYDDIVTDFMEIISIQTLIQFFKPCSKKIYIYMRRKWR